MTQKDRSMVTDQNQQSDWHSRSIETVSQALATPENGLTERTVAERLAQYGRNELAPSKPRSTVLRFLSQFHNLLLYLMMAAGVITALLGEWIDAGVLWAAVLINAFIGFIQEGKAESALLAIRGMLAPHATVIRDGHRKVIEAADLVPGDKVVVASGDRVPADIRLLHTRELRVDEASLTGESMAVEKSSEPVATDAMLGDRSSMAYSGTLVVSGQATGLVVATGIHTEIGRISRMMGGIEATATPLMRKINGFSFRLAVFILGIALLTFVFGVTWRGYELADMFLMVVALVASAIPEGLPAIMTIILALGVQRMSRHNAIIRRLPAVETLGSVTVICSDKTGTLTRNEMTVQRVVTASESYEITGVGYMPEGEFIAGGRQADMADCTELMPALQTGMLCNESGLQCHNGTWHITGDPTEGALMVLAAKAGLDHEQLLREQPRLDSIPFESENRYMATYHRDDQGQDVILVKGAPERILAMCQWQLSRDGADALDVDYWRRMANDIAGRGLRLLALGSKRASPQRELLAACDVETGFTMLALVGIIDPPREEAIIAVAQCHGAHIRVKMITGDHADTARAVGAQLGIGVGKPAITGAEISLLDDESWLVW